MAAHRGIFWDKYFEFHNMQVNSCFLLNWILGYWEDLQTTSYLKQGQRGKDGDRIFCSGHDVLNKSMVFRLRQVLKVCDQIPKVLICHLLFVCNEHIS